MHFVRKLLLMTFLTTVSLSHAVAKNVYRSSCLERLAKSLAIQVDTLPTGEFIFSNYSRPVVVKIANGWITHVGYRLFPSEMKTSRILPLLEFLERYFLQLHYPANRTIPQMLRDDRVKFEKGHVSDIEYIKENDGFSIANSDRRYVASWYNGDNAYLIVSFPMEYELLSGENKIEAEKNFEYRLNSFNISTEASIEPNAESLVPTIQQSFYIMKGGTYISRELSADQFYIKSSNGYELLSDVLHPAESFANIMLNPHAVGDYTLDVTQILYGYNQKKYSISLKKWVSYCQSEGCHLYFGIEGIEKDVVSGVVVASNPTEGYDHFMFVKVAYNMLDNRCGKIKAKLETYIPTHNVANLFEKYKKKNVRPKIIE